MGWLILIMVGLLALAILVRLLPFIIAAVILGLIILYWKIALSVVAVIVLTLTVLIFAIPEENR